MADGIENYRLTDHAAFQMVRRGIAEGVLRQVLTAPERRRMVRPGRDVLQSQIVFDGRTYLVRVFVDVDRKPAEIVTVYRTSNVAKYWRAQP